MNVRDRDERGVRLQKYLSRAGVASRRVGERLIVEGRVSVDGETVTELGTRVVPGEQLVTVDGEVIGLPAPRWIALHKPTGYLTSRKGGGRETVYDLLPAEHRQLFYVGRLDLLTRGLVIFTNEGAVAHRLLHPRYAIPRRYRVEVAGDVGAATLRRLERGVELEDGPARAEDVTLAPRVADSGVTTELGLTLREGRNREVRRLLAAVGLSIESLVRVSFGPVRLGDLAPGGWRELAPEEVGSLKAAVELGETHGDT